MKYNYHKDGTHDPSQVFVFGSNLRGVHGAGAARYAHTSLGAEWGVGEGVTGSCYAIPTKDENIQTLSLETIEKYVDEFLDFARHNPGTQFCVTRIGCGLAGYDDADIAPMFQGAPTNCNFAEEWKMILEGSDG